jgi:hypothetical protein
MRIVTINAPGKLGNYYSGIAESTRGRRYMWVSLVNENVRSVFREEAGGFWEEMPPPPELVGIIREAVTSAAARKNAEAKSAKLRRGHRPVIAPRHLVELEEGALFWRREAAY